jgi:hypothetical protein
MSAKVPRRVIGLVSSLILFAISVASQEQQSGIDSAVASQYFSEAAELCSKDGARLWGISLAGPVLFVDPRTRMVVANQADGEGKLRQQEGVFTGKLPPEVNIANTATRWAGIKWTMIIWPLPEERRSRLRLMAHELFHRVQDQLGLTAPEASNRHLDSREGRTWLILEWRALERALQETGLARREALIDALYFRRYRQALSPQATVEELSLETQEGLAEYTGLALSGRSDGERGVLAAYALRQGRNSQSFVRSFAYSSAPAYGVLLDHAGISWRRTFKSGGDLSRRLERGLALKLTGSLEAEAKRRAKIYDGDEVIAAETRRERIRVELSARNRAKLVDGAVLVLPVAGSFSYSFNPGNLVPLDNLGTVYPTMRATDDWGILEVTDGALLIRDATQVKKIQVAAPSSTRDVPLTGPGWTLQLNAGWTIVSGPRAGDYTVRKQL